jgi:hypothetical protein
VCAFLAFCLYGFSTSNLSERFQNYSEMFHAKVEAFDQLQSAPVDYVVWPSFLHAKTPVEALGQVLYTYYFYFFFSSESNFIDCYDWCDYVNFKSTSCSETSRSF